MEFLESSSIVEQFIEVASTIENRYEGRLCKDDLNVFAKED
jgi:hypothetical protein